MEYAKKQLNKINETTVAAIRSKQAARLVLSKEAEMVKTMVHEGLLSSQHAEEFLEEIGRDTERIEYDRSRMYVGQSGDKDKGTTGRESLLSWFGIGSDSGNDDGHQYEPVLHEPLIDNSRRL